MCGIAGYVSSSPDPGNENRVRAMTADLARRGPDAEGIETWDGAVFGHRRLSIFDLSDLGRQPMLAPDRSVGVVFNGAIYNFLELRADLQKAGYSFRSNTDTEVLIHGYREWGIDKLVERLRGMFAIGLWDDRERRLFLIRDRLGVKPLVYAHRPDGNLAFASTVRALRAAGVAGELDPAAATEYLEYGYVTDKRTIYKEAAKVPAAHILEWHNGKLKSRRYWQVPAPRNSAVRFEEALEQTERLFLEAVRLRLAADVPVGALLSGGVDSSLVCWAISTLGADVTAFTVGTPGDPDDETSDAVQTAQRLGIRHQIIPLSADQAPDVAELVDAYGEPFACASALGMLGVSQAVRASATVLLTGDGGDDVFLGYPGHRHFLQAQKVGRMLPGPLARGWYAVRKPLAGVGGLRRAVHFLDYATGGIGAVVHAKDGLPFYHRNGMLGPKLEGVGLAEREIAWSPESGREILADFLEYEHTHRFYAEYMTKVDGGAMHYALEARSPFLDQEIWNFAASLPFETRLQGGTLKAILRELARRKIGDRVATGAKRGFTIPVTRWIAGKWQSRVQDAFRDSVLAREGWIDGPAVLRAVENSAQRGSATNHLWYLYVLETWLRHQKSMEARPLQVAAR